jgi:hypothetical protein
MSCVNKNLQEVKDIAGELNMSPAIAAIKIGFWQANNTEDRFPTVDELKSKKNEANYQLKAVNILASNKAEQMFTKGKKNGWDLNKILTELAIPKEQKQIILDKNIKETKKSSLKFISQSKRGDNAYNISLNGEFIGDFDLLKDEGKWVIDNVGLNKEFKGKGLGKESFITANSLIPTGEGVLHSSGYFEGNDAKNVWNSLVKTGEAEKIGTDEWRFKNNNNFNLREEILTSLLDENSFVVEVNTAKTDNFEFNTKPILITENYVTLINDYGAKIGQYAVDLSDFDGAMYKFFDTKEEAYELYNEPGENTSYYSNLTVPGGINYTENEVSTPDITPNIKGHGQFSTDNGIGWFRSDDKQSADRNKLSKLERDTLREDGMSEYEINKLEDTTDSNVRRILEVQSDLFQKGRDKKDLTTYDSNLDADLYRENFDSIEEMKEYEKNSGKKDNKSKENNFLQLLNKKGNWVNFFIESIVQDSAKKGYKKVLFPTGETAAKVEGHETVVDEIKRKDKAIFDSEQEIQKLSTLSKEELGTIFFNPVMFNSKTETEQDELINNHIKSREKNINTFKEEKDNLKTQSLEKLKPVESFYTNKVTNILNKKYKGKVKEITDEHGNTWNEIDLKLEDANQSFILQLNTQQSKKDASKFYESIVEKDAVTEYDADKSKETIAKDRTDILQALFNGRMSPVSANDFLKSLKSNTNLNLSTEALQLIDSMLASRAKIRFVSSAALENGKDTYAQYNTTGRIILINRDVLGEGNVYFAIESILHEIVHDMTVNAYNNPTTDKRAAFKKAVDELYKKALANNSNEEATGIYYGLSSPEEFIAEIMTNKAFRDALMEDDRSTFTKFIDAIKTLLGITTNEINKELIDSLMESVLDVSKTEYNTNEVSPLHRSYEKNTRDTIYESVSDVNTDLKNKLSNLNSEINKMKDRLESAKDGFKRKGNISKGKSVQNLIDIIEKKQEKEALQSVVAYVDFALTEMENIDQSLNDNKYHSSIDKMGSVFKSINLYSDTKTLVNTLNYMKNNDLITEDDYDAVSSKVTMLGSVVNNVTDRSLNLAKDILAKQMAPYNVETKKKYENQYRKEVIK